MFIANSLAVMVKNNVEDWHYNKFRSNFIGRCRWTLRRKSQGWWCTTQRLKKFLPRSKGVPSPYFLADSFLVDGSRLGWLIAGRDFCFTKDHALLKDFPDFLSKPTDQDNMTKRVYERIRYHSAHYDRPMWSKWIHQCGFIDCTNDTGSMKREPWSKPNTAPSPWQEFAQPAHSCDVGFCNSVKYLLG